MIHNLEFNYYY